MNAVSHGQRKFKASAVAWYGDLFDCFENYALNDYISVYEGHQQIN